MRGACHLSFAPPAGRRCRQADEGQRRMPDGNGGPRPIRRLPQRAAQFAPRRKIVRISGTSNSLATWPSEE
ncbi:hypothetical protein CN116_23175 [Sinorhizobium meliloti]|nr:hypothetical protein DA101_009170 [Sinorhizobium meliloti]RVM07811.1 hypothetical protein CN125_18615 [Sinorhizobium meliloti]RVM39845.1 hypothetical protein CN121_32155 [Sinorhizobium meliloti]RVM70728.1 hypothetical protein CN124_05825 [Sinorhizobium meliloti]RVM81422.1 hypothetical protein CN117_22605 [Sinorhizobium meliloti]